MYASPFLVKPCVSNDIKLGNIKGLLKIFTSLNILIMLCYTNKTEI